MPIEGWKINVNAARGVVSDAKVLIDDMAETIPTKANTRFSAAATACESLDIGDALDTVLTDLLGPILKGLPDAGYWICGQTNEAIDAYVAGDETMATDAQDAVGQVPDTKG